MHGAVGIDFGDHAEDVVVAILLGLGRGQGLGQRADRDGVDAGGGGRQAQALGVDLPGWPPVELEDAVAVGLRDDHRLAHRDEAVGGLGDGLQGGVRETNGESSVLIDLVVNDLVARDAAHVVGGGRPEDGDAGAQHRLESGDAAVILDVDTGREQVDEAGVWLGRLDGRRELQALVVGVVAEDLIDVGHGQLGAAHGHDRHVLHGLADALAPDHPAAGAADHARAGREPPGLFGQGRELVAHRRVNNDEVAVLVVFTQGRFEALGDGAAGVDHSGAGGVKA